MTQQATRHTCCHALNELRWLLHLPAYNVIHLGIVDSPLQFVVTQRMMGIAAVNM
ncbi:unknown [Prevotella sp. CAG:5226]|nr:unknown [Prevotella sp. CAG:5226]